MHGSRISDVALADERIVTFGFELPKPFGQDVRILVGQHQSMPFAQASGHCHAKGTGTDHDRHLSTRPDVRSDDIWARIRRTHGCISKPLPLSMDGVAVKVVAGGHWGSDLGQLAAD
jgi:hypothetical protein